MIVAKSVPIGIKEKLKKSLAEKVGFRILHLQRNHLSHGIFQSILSLFTNRSRHGFSPREVTLQFPLVACFAVFIPSVIYKTATI